MSEIPIWGLQPHDDKPEAGNKPNFKKQAELLQARAEQNYRECRAVLKPYEDYFNSQANDLALREELPQNVKRSRRFLIKGGNRFYFSIGQTSNRVDIEMKVGIGKRDSQQCRLIRMRRSSLPSDQGTYLTFDEDGLIQRISFKDSGAVSGELAKSVGISMPYDAFFVEVGDPRKYFLGLSVGDIKDRWVSRTSPHRPFVSVVEEAIRMAVPFDIPGTPSQAK